MKDHCITNNRELFVTWKLKCIQKGAYGCWIAKGVYHPAPSPLFYALRGDDGARALQTTVLWGHLLSLRFCQCGVSQAGPERNVEEKRTCFFLWVYRRFLEVLTSVTALAAAVSFLPMIPKSNVQRLQKELYYLHPSPSARDPDISTSWLEPVLLRSVWEAALWGPSYGLRDVSANRLKPTSSEVSASQDSFSKLLSFNKSNLFPFSPCPKNRSCFMQLLPLESLEFSF